MYLPAKYKRPGTYLFLTNWLEKRAGKPEGEIEWWLENDVEYVIKEIDAAHPDDAEIQAFKPRLQTLIGK